MQSFWFWKNWNKEYRFIWYGMGLLFITALFFLWYSYLKSPELLVHWEKYQNQKTIESVTHTFEVGNFEFSVPIESYLTFEYFNASPFKLNITSSYFFIIGLALVFVIMFTVITTLPRFWYFIGTGLSILFIVSLRLDVLRIFELHGRIVTLVSVIAYVSLGFYFNTFRKTAAFTTRLLSFLLITTVIGILIHYFAAVEYPFLYLSVAGYIPGMVLSVIFIIMIAHEILASFVYLTSQGTSTSKSLQHFLIISIIYIVNLVFAYMHEAGLIRWDFVFVNLYLLLTISGILSIWGYRKRESLYENITSFDPFGGYFIVSLSIITFITTGMFLGTGNDAALKIIRDSVIFSHLGFGVIFLLYFFSNFIVMMAENLNVYKVLYAPTRMPYATYRIAGLIAMLAFVFYSDWHTYVYYATAGVYNSMGDLQQVIGQNSVAEAYYRQARVFAVNNYHGNYALAGMETQKKDFEKAHSYYTTINRRGPTEFSLVNDANLFLFENNFFYSTSSFEDAFKKFPESGIIKNNLAYSYLKLQAYDSAFLLFDQARKKAVSKETAEINLAGVLAQNQVAVQADSLIHILSPSDAVLSNVILIAAQQKQQFTPDFQLDKKQLDLYSATLLNNYIVYKLEELDTAFTNKAFQIASDSVNSDFTEALKATLSHAYYYQNNVAKALQLMGEVSYITQSMQGKFNYIMGLWALEQGNASLAVKCFAYAAEQDYKEAKIYNAIALAEANMPDEALDAAQVLLQSKNQSDQEIGRQLKNIYMTSQNEVIRKTDLEKYQYCRYRIGLADSVKFNQILNTVDNPNYRALLLLEMSQRQFNAGSSRSAIRYFSKLNGIRFTDKNLNDRINHFELELLASRNEVRLLGTKINEGITFTQKTNLQKLLYTALISETSGDSLTAKKNYEILARYNPFYEEGILAAARYFKEHSPDKFKAYTILTDAIHINPGSVRLLMAYITEATRVGFDDFAADAYEELEVVRLKNK